MKTQLRFVRDGELRYPALLFLCPGCEADDAHGSGLHLLPVNTTEKSPSWNWDGDLEKPTLSPSILTGKGSTNICHSFLESGVFRFLPDSTHPLSGQQVPIPDLPDWAIKED